MPTEQLTNVLVTGVQKELSGYRAVLVNADDVFYVLLSRTAKTLKTDFVDLNLSAIRCLFCRLAAVYACLCITFCTLSYALTFTALLNVFGAPWSTRKKLSWHRLLWTHPVCFYYPQGGNVVTSVLLFVCLSVCLSVC